MQRSTFSIGLVSTLALTAGLAMAPARADLVLLGSDYFTTIQPTSFTPLGGLNPLVGLSIGPGNTDTIVRRLADCSLSLSTAGLNCTIPIEMVALSLVSSSNPAVRLRESPTIASTGSMTMASDGSGNGGTFASFFDVFAELSLDNGATWTPLPDIVLTSSGSQWSTFEKPLFVDGVIADQNANRHTNKNSLACPVFLTGQQCVDFFVVGSVTEQHPDGSMHTATQAIPEPGGLALAGLALAAAAALRRRAQRSAG